MNAIILSVGDELTLGQTVDTNSAWLSARLTANGVLPLRHETVADDQDAIVEAVRRAALQCDWLIISGGLGPTQDDLTRQSLAQATGVELVMHVPSLDRLRRFFEERGRVMSDSNQIQALCPADAEMLENPKGTAPGIRLRLGRAWVFAFPGVPSEMKVMFDLHVLPRIQSVRGRVILTKKLNTFGLGESGVGERLGALMRRDRNPQVGTTVADGIVAVRLRSDFADAAQARAALEQTEAEVRAALGEAVFGQDDETLADAVAGLLAERSLTIATAESCTAGLLGKMLTDRSGSSAWFLGGWLVYANRLKSECLGVPPNLIEREGAVSEAVALCMASAALSQSGADRALAITGIAGPDGGTAIKPVGTVWIALARKAEHGPEVKAERFFLIGDRAMIRDRAAKSALNMARLALM